MGIVITGCQALLEQDSPPEGPGEGVVLPEIGAENHLSASVQAAYDQEQLAMQISWESNKPYAGIFHDVIAYDSESGVWEKTGEFSEDRVLVMLEDRDYPVEGFDTAGCYISCHSDMNEMPDNTGDSRHYVLSQGAEDTGDFALDMWHWRGGRSGPMGYAEDTWVSKGEYQSEYAGRERDNLGEPPTNWVREDGDRLREEQDFNFTEWNEVSLPRFVFNPERVEFNNYFYADQEGIITNSAELAYLEDIEYPSLGIVYQAPELEEPVLEKSAVEEEEPRVEEAPIIEEPPTEEPVEGETPIIEEPPTEEPVEEEEPEIEEPPIEEPVEEEEPEIEEPPTEEPIEEEEPELEEPIDGEPPELEEDNLEAYLAAQSENNQENKVNTIDVEYLLYVAEEIEEPEYAGDWAEFWAAETGVTEAEEAIAILDEIADSAAEGAVSFSQVAFIYNSSQHDVTSEMDFDYDNNQFSVVLYRDLEIDGELRDDASLADLAAGEVYNLSFAVHDVNQGRLSHHISFPYTIGNEESDADIEAVEVEELKEINWAEIATFETGIYQPGTVSLQHLEDPAHHGIGAGAVFNNSCQSCHTTEDAAQRSEAFLD